jgi:hypothetical protein
LRVRAPGVLPNSCAPSASYFETGQGAWSDPGAYRSECPGECHGHSTPARLLVRQDGPGPAGEIPPLTGPLMARNWPSGLCDLNPGICTTGARFPIIHKTLCGFTYGKACVQGGGPRRRNGPSHGILLGRRGQETGLGFQIWTQFWPLWKSQNGAR